MSINDINDTNSNSGLAGVGIIPPAAPVASFNLPGIQSLIDTKGFLAFHIRHAINPNRETVNSGIDPSSPVSERMYLYYDVRPIRIIPQNFGVRDQLAVQGVYDMSGGIIFNVSGNYLNGEQDRVFVRQNDLILLNPTITELYQQIVEYKGEERIKLHYKAVDIDYLATSDRRFENGSDVVVNSDGTISFTKNAQKPKAGNDAQNGAVLSIVYYKTPIYVVKNMPHSLRIIPSNDQGSGAFPRTAVYAPQLVIADNSIVRESNNYFDLPEVQDYRKYMNPIY